MSCALYCACLASEYREQEIEREYRSTFRSVNIMFTRKQRHTAGTLFGKQHARRLLKPEIKFNKFRPRGDLARLR